MKQILFQSERLLFREWNKADAVWLKDLNDDPDVLKFTGDVPFASVLDAESFIENYEQYKLHGFGRWAVFLIENQMPIGWCGLKYNEEKQIDIGFRFFRKYWNQGFATEAAKATLFYAFESLFILEVVGRASVKNIASIKVLENAGLAFWKEGKVNDLEDVVYYKMRNPFL